jgi:hypothetical protein
VEAILYWVGLGLIALGGTVRMFVSDEKEANAGWAFAFMGVLVLILQACTSA